MGKTWTYGFDEGDAEFVGNVGDPFLEVVIEKVLQLAGKLHARRASTDDDHVQQSAPLLFGLVFEVGRLDAVHDATSNLENIAHVSQTRSRRHPRKHSQLSFLYILAHPHAPLKRRDSVEPKTHTRRIRHLLQKQAMLPNPRNAKRRILRAHAHDQHVKRHLGTRNIALDRTVIVNVHYFLLVVDLGRLGLVVLGRGPLVAQDVANGLHQRARLDEARRAAGQEGREEEEVARRDDDDVVVFRVELLEEGDGAPAGACFGGERVWLALLAQILILDLFFTCV